MKEEKKKIRFLTLGKSSGKSLKFNELEKIQIPDSNTKKNTKSDELKKLEKMDHFKIMKRKSPKGETKNKFDSDFKNIIHLKDEEIILLKNELKKLNEDDLKSSRSSEIISSSDNSEDLKEKLVLYKNKLILADQENNNLKNDNRLLKQSIQFEKERRLLAELKESRTSERSQDLLSVLEKTQRDVSRLFTLITTMLPNGVEKTSILEKYDYVEEYVTRSIESFIEFKETCTEELCTTDDNSNSLRSPRSFSSNYHSRSLRNFSVNEKNMRHNVIMQETFKGLTNSTNLDSTDSHSEENEFKTSNTSSRNTSPLENGELSKIRKKRSNSDEIYFQIQEKKLVSAQHEQEQKLQKLNKRKDLIVDNSQDVESEPSSNIVELSPRVLSPTSLSSGNIHEGVNESPVKLNDFGGVKVKTKISDNQSKERILRGLNEHGFDLERIRQSSLSYSNMLIEKLKAKDELEKIDKISSELFNTEKDYVDNLKVIIEVFYQPLKKSSFVTEKDIESIFSIVDHIYAFNTDLLKDLSTEMEKPLESRNIGSVFLSRVGKLKIYTVFCAEMPKSRNVVNNLFNNNKEFSQFLLSAQENQRCRFLAVGSFLVKPMQRMCKYPLLLKELRDASSRQSSHKDLCDAYEKVKKVVEEIDLKVTQAENYQKITEIQDLLDIKTPLLRSGRKYISETNIVLCKVIKKTKSAAKKLKLFLFNDILLFAKHTRGEKFSLYLIEERSKVVVNNGNISKENKLSIEILCLDRDISYLLSFTSSQLRNEWFEHLTVEKKSDSPVN